MGVRAADAERAHAGATGRVTHGPRSGLPAHLEWALREGDKRVGRAKVGERRQYLFGERPGRLDHAGHAGGRVKVADRGLDRAQPRESRAVGFLPERLRKRGDLDRVSDRGARPVRLDVLDGVRRHAGERQGLADYGCVAIHARGEVTHLISAVIVHRGRLDDGVNVVARGERVAQPPQDHHANAAGEHGPVRFRVEGPADPVRGEDLTLPVEVALTMWHLNGHAPGERHVAFPVEQGLGRQVDGHE